MVNSLLLHLLLLPGLSQGQQTASAERNKVIGAVIEACQTHKAYSPELMAATTKAFGGAASERIGKYFELRQAFQNSHPNFSPTGGGAAGSCAITLDFDKRYELPVAPKTREERDQIIKHEYGKDGSTFTFIGGPHIALLHAMGGAEPAIKASMDAIRTEISGEPKPGFLLLEGLPTASGVYPCEVLDALAFDTLETVAKTKGELGYAVLLALEHNVPFMGAEVPTEVVLDTASNGQLVKTMRYAYPKYSREDLETYLLFIELAQDAMQHRIPLAKSIDRRFGSARVRETLERLNKLFRKFENKDLDPRQIGAYVQPVVPPAGLGGMFLFSVEIRDAYLRQLIKAAAIRNKRSMAIFGSAHALSNDAILRSWFSEGQTCSTGGAPQKSGTVAPGGVAR